MTRNPKWSRDELILALDLYMRVNPVHTSDINPEIIELSEILNSLPIHPHTDHRENFRNANGVYMKLCNFLRFDPNYKGTGLQRGGKLEEVIWDEFSQDQMRLGSIAAAIRKGSQYVPPPTDEVEVATEEEEEFPEGRVLTQLHKRRERNPKVVHKKKKIILEESGALTCEVCKFDFFLVYGELGYGFAECHHHKPLSELLESKTTNVGDLAIVCANCHRMLHRARPWKTIDELRELLKR